MTNQARRAWWMGLSAACLSIGSGACISGAERPQPAGEEPPAAAAPAAVPAPGGGRLATVQPVFADVDRLFTSFAEGVHAPGIVWGVLIDGELVHRGSWGVRDVEARVPVDSATVFRIASMTKSFTALAILKLRDEGLLRLDDPAEMYVPELRTLVYPTLDSPKITVRHLLSHAGGFPEDNPWGDRQLARTDAEMGEMMRRGIPFSNSPGLAYEYSNFGFAILGRIVTNVSNQPYATYVAAHLLAPLGMTATTLEAAMVPADRLAHGYRREDDAWRLEPPLPDGSFGAMGGMLTSLEDLGRYVGFLMRAYPPRDDAETGPVRRASVRQMQQVSRTRPTTVRQADGGAVQLSSGGYGFGLRVSQTCDLGHVVAHTGGLPGYGSVMTWLPEYGVGVVAMVNLTYTSASAVAGDALALLVRNAGLVPRSPTPSPALVEARQAVTRLVTAWDDTLADQIAADNLFLDQSRDRRKHAIEGLRSQVGTCRADEAFDVENALRGQWTMTCDRGTLLVSITLAPTMPPKVQHLAVRTIEPGARRRPPACQQ
ncbi:MAG TPA: serine hydrolase domain-containing protein [Vicinamibacterales bacterium]|nr:serine hydrolase domain-containing protein [Vicinamibacterales bacterium]